MLKCLRLALTALVVMLSVFPAIAQDVPQPINAALADLSGRAGRSLGLLDIEKWSYVQSNYPSPALGCPQSGVAYADVITGGFQFIITYGGSDYDYRVSNDQSIVILCGTTAAPPATPACPPDDSDFLPARLSIGVQGRVSAGGIPNLLRDQPGSSGNPLGQIPPGESFTILDGPRCSLLDKIVWWQVNYGGLIGWTAEGKDGEYWLEPLNLETPTLPTLDVIANANANVLAQLYTSTSTVIAISPVTTSVATGDASGNITLFDFLTNIQQSVTLAHTGAVTSLVMGFDARQLLYLLASGGADGLVKIWEISPQGTLKLLAQLSGHSGAVNALAFNPAGSLLVTGGADRSIRVWDAATGTLLKQLDLHASAVSSVQFSPGSNSIVSRDVNGTLVISAVVTGGTPESAGY